MKKFFNLLFFFKIYFKKKYFGFVKGHSYLNSDQLVELNNIILNNNIISNSIVYEFENKFAKEVGSGFCTSFASARMAFYSLLNVLNISNGDEVIIQAANCSVMVNAILKSGATPIFSDIDPDTYGSSPFNIENKITQKTKLIVAQHSFGIPCDILKIRSIATKNNIFLLEDCALTFGSSISGINVGNFGDAAIFSTDHSKPINTFIGGMFYSNNFDLNSRVHCYANLLEDLSIVHQKNIFKRILLEKVYFIPEKYGKWFLYNYFINILYKIKIKTPVTNILTDDYTNPLLFQNKSNYPYPAKLPKFLARLGLFELERWKIEKNNRELILANLLDLLKNTKYSSYIPKVYFDKEIKIIPLRFVFSCADALKLRKKLLSFIDVNGFWFLKPIVACSNPTEFGYLYGSCTEAEKLETNIINIPCNFDIKYMKCILYKLKLKL